MTEQEREDQEVGLIGATFNTLGDGWNLIADIFRNEETIKKRKEEEAAYPLSNHGLWGYFRNSEIGRGLGIDDKSTTKREIAEKNGQDEPVGFLGSIGNSFSSLWNFVADPFRDEEEVKKRKEEEAARPMANRGLWDFTCNSALGRSVGLDDKSSAERVAAEAQREADIKAGKDVDAGFWGSIGNSLSGFWNFIADPFRDDAEVAKRKAEEAAKPKSNRGLWGYICNSALGRSIGLADEPQTAENGNTAVATNSAAQTNSERKSRPLARAEWIPEKDNEKAKREVNAAVKANKFSTQGVLKALEKAQITNEDETFMYQYKALKLSQLTSKAEQKKHGIINSDNSLNLDALNTAITANGFCTLDISGEENSWSFQKLGPKSGGDSR